MRGQYTRYPANLPGIVQMNAGIIVDDFDPQTGEIGAILGATGSGIEFDANPVWEDFGSDIDNIPRNTAGLKRVVGYAPAASGTFKTITPALAKQLNGASAYGAVGQAARILPKHALTASDFSDIWIIGDYANAAEGEDAGYVAVHLKRALNQAGFRWKTHKDGKGEFEFDYRGHYDLSNPDDAPFEIYVRGG